MVRQKQEDTQESSGINIFKKYVYVTHTKDNIEWSLEEEDKFLSILKNHRFDSFPLLRQANKI